MRFARFILIAAMLTVTNAFAAPRCLDLSRAQAEKAVTVMKIAIAQGAPLILVSKKESGLVRPLGVWLEKKNRKNKPSSYRIRVDGREVDISLVYVARSANENRAYNVGWMSGCRPAAGKPLNVRNY